MEDIAHRQQLAVDSILDNESLTAGLDDQAARLLLEWSTALARTIVQDAASLDDAAAETAIEERLAAVRGLMRQVNRWAVRRAEMSPEDLAGWLDLVLEKVGAALGGQLTAPDAAQRQAFLASYGGSQPVEMVLFLRSLVGFMSTPAPGPTPLPEPAPAPEPEPAAAPVPEPPAPEPPAPAGEPKKTSWWNKIFGGG